MPQHILPMVVDNTEARERSYDLYSLLLKNRLVFLGGPINAELANLTIAQLLYLAGEGAQQPIHLYVSSPGGEVYQGLAIYDAMQMIDAPVYTYAVGMTASMGTALLAAGAKGHRYALPHATIHMHPTSSGARGYTEDIRIAFREQERMQTQLFYLLGKLTGHSWKEIEGHFERDRWMNAMEAKNFGLVDQILGDIGSLVLGVEQGQLQLAGDAAGPEERGNGHLLSKND